MVKKIPAETYFGEKKFLQIVMLKKRNSYSEDIARVPPLRKCMNAKQEIELIHCQSNDSRPTYREQYTINDTFANRLAYLFFPSPVGRPDTQATNRRKL